MCRNDFAAEALEFKQTRLAVAETDLENTMSELRAARAALKVVEDKIAKLEAEGTNVVTKEETSAILSRCESAALPSPKGPAASFSPRCSTQHSIGWPVPTSPVSKKLWCVVRIEFPVQAPAAAALHMSSCQLGLQMVPFCQTSSSVQDEHTWAVVDVRGKGMLSIGDELHSQLGDIHLSHDSLMLVMRGSQSALCRRVSLSQMVRFQCNHKIPQDRFSMLLAGWHAVQPEERICMEILAQWFLKLHVSDPGNHVNLRGLSLSADSQMRPSLTCPSSDLKFQALFGSFGAQFVSNLVTSTLLFYADMLRGSTDGMSFNPLAAKESAIVQRGCCSRQQPAKFSQFDFSMVSDVQQAFAPLDFSEALRLLTGDTLSRWNTGSLDQCNFKRVTLLSNPYQKLSLVKVDFDMGSLEKWGDVLRAYTQHSQLAKLLKADLSIGAGQTEAGCVSAAQPPMTSSPPSPISCQRCISVDELQNAEAENRNAQTTLAQRALRVVWLNAGPDKSMRFQLLNVTHQLKTGYQTLRDGLEDVEKLLTEVGLAKHAHTIIDGLGLECKSDFAVLTGEDLELLGLEAEQHRNLQALVDAQTSGLSVGTALEWTLHFRCSDGQAFDIKAFSSATVQELMFAVMEQRGIHTKSQRLVFAGRTLGPDDTLELSHLVNHAKIFLLVKSANVFEADFSTPATPSFGSKAAVPRCQIFQMDDVQDCNILLTPTFGREAAENKCQTFKMDVECAQDNSLHRTGRESSLARSYEALDTEFTPCSSEHVNTAWTRPQHSAAFSVPSFKPPKLPRSQGIPTSKLQCSSGVEFYCLEKEQSRSERDSSLARSYDALGALHLVEQQCPTALSAPAQLPPLKLKTPRHGRSPSQRSSGRHRTVVAAASAMALDLGEEALGPFRSASRMDAKRVQQDSPCRVDSSWNPAALHVSLTKAAAPFGNIKTSKLPPRLPSLARQKVPSGTISWDAQLTRPARWASMAAVF